MRRFFYAIAVLTVGVASMTACGNDAPPPGAFVGMSCRTDYDCGGLYCVDPAGGTCQAPCRGDVDCGPGYHCKSESRHGTGGNVDVCRPN